MYVYVMGASGRKHFIIIIVIFQEEAHLHGRCKVRLEVGQRSNGDYVPIVGVVVVVLIVVGCGGGGGCWWWCRCKYWVGFNSHILLLAARCKSYYYYCCDLCRL